MIQIIQSYKTEASVIAIHSGKDEIYFTDCDGKLHLIDKTTYNRSSVSIVNETEIPLHQFQKGASFSANGYVAYSIRDGGSCAMCLNTSSIKPKTEEEEVAKSENHQFFLDKSTKFYGNDQKAEVISFCGNRGEYLFTGGTDGRVHMYSTKSGKVLMTLRPKPEYISSITVSKDGSFLAYGAFDKSFTILNLRYQREELSRYFTDIIENSFFFNNSKSFYAIGRDGNSYTYDFTTDVLSKKALFPIWPHCCVLDSSGRFAIVGGRSQMLYIVKLSDNSIVSSFKLDQYGISSLHVKDHTLFIGFENGWMYIIDMYAYIDDFSQALTIKDFKNARKYLNKNIFLTIHPLSEIFEEAWEEVIKEIMNLFSTGNSALAMQAAESFLSDENHKKEFTSLLHKQKEFEKFSLLVQKKEFFDAYGMLDRSPYLSKTDSARKLELYFSKKFSEAKKLISSDPLRNITKAKELLKPFSLVSVKKDSVNSLFKNYDIYLKADSFIKEKKFKEYFMLTQMHSFLIAEDVYKKVCSLAESSILKIKDMIENGVYPQALEGIKQIIIFLPYKEELTNIFKDLQLRQKCLNLIHSDNIENIYGFIEKYPQLESMKEFVAYDKKFDLVLAKAMNSVANGDIKSVQQILLPYVKTDIFKPKIKECLRQASFNKLNNFLVKNYLSEARAVCAYYLREFGKDKDYESLIKQYNFEL
jgi:hypothetical protein